MHGFCSQFFDLLRIKDVLSSWSFSKNKVWTEQKLWSWTPDYLSFDCCLKFEDIYIFLSSKLEKKRNQYLHWIRESADFFLSFSHITGQNNDPPSTQKHLFKYIFSRPTKRLASWHCLRVAFLLQQINCHQACTTTMVSWSFQQGQAIVVRLKRCCQQHCFLLSRLFLSTYFYLKCQKYLNIKT